MTFVVTHGEEKNSTLSMISVSNLLFYIYFCKFLRKCEIQSLKFYCLFFLSCVERDHVCYLAEFWQADVHTCPEACAQVGGTCEDVAQMFVPHKFPASLLDQMLHLWDVTRYDQSHKTMSLHIWWI